MQDARISYPIQCEHCGRWHYGYSRISKNYAKSAAQTLVDKCLKAKEIRERGNA